MPLDENDKLFLRQLIDEYFSDRKGSIQAINGGGAVTLAAATPALIMDQNEFRSVATIVNTDAVNDTYVNFASGTAVTGTGILLKSNGGSLVFGKGSDIPYTGRVWAISAGTPTLVFTELSVQH